MDKHKHASEIKESITKQLSGTFVRRVVILKFERISECSDAFEERWDL